ncbi:hypothetical protein B7494_g3711 [Chlorociboria aeruginascens]|nr:hypothetical protein B7494_g3711 [Chlorociboria aeruginascens]
MATIAGKPIGTDGLGLMRLTWAIGPVPEELALKVLKTAVECGANVWNGADFYGTPEYNSLHLMNKYFNMYPEDAEKVVLTIKSGVVSMKTFELDASPEGMRKFVDNANKILDGKKKIDAFGPARIDPKVPVETTVAALGELVEEGKIGGIQLTEVRADTIRRASKVYKIDMIEAEVSLWSTDIFTNGVGKTCGELNIPILAYCPLGAGMLTGNIKKIEDMPPNNHYQQFPRYQGENFKQNLELVNQLAKLAKAKGCTPAQLALSWIRSTSGKDGMAFIVPISGPRSEERVRENCSDFGLSEGDLKEIKVILDTFPVVGERFPPRAIVFNEY